MFLAKMSHGNLKLRNVSLVHGDNPITYQIDARSYTIRTRYLAKINDFRRASVMRHNPTRQITQFSDFYSFAQHVYAKTGDVRVLQTCLNEPIADYEIALKTPSQHTKELPEIIASICDNYCTRVAPVANAAKYNCSQIRFEADGRFNNDSYVQFNELETATQTLTTTESKLNETQRVLAQLNLEVQTKESTSKSLLLKNENMFDTMTLKKGKVKSQAQSNDEQVEAFITERVRMSRQELLRLKAKRTKLKAVGAALVAAGGTAAYKIFKAGKE
jgi:hypothetical protein